MKSIDEQDADYREETSEMLLSGFLLGLHEISPPYDESDRVMAKKIVVATESQEALRKTLERICPEGVDEGLLDEIPEVRKMAQRVLEESEK